MFRDHDMWLCSSFSADVASVTTPTEIHSWMKSCWLRCNLGMSKVMLVGSERFFLKTQLVHILAPLLSTYIPQSKQCKTSGSWLINHWTWTIRQHPWQTMASSTSFFCPLPPKQGHDHSKWCICHPLTGLLWFRICSWMWETCEGSRWCEICLIYRSDS